MMFRLSTRDRLASAHVHPTQRGMTLVEVMIVLTIIASIAGMVGFYAVGFLKNAKIKTATTELGTLRQAVDSYYVFSNEYPNSLDELASPSNGMAPVIKEVPNDPWGNPYQYSKSCEGDEPEISCLGPDGHEGTQDDITPPHVNRH